MRSHRPERGATSAPWHVPMQSGCFQGTRKPSRTPSKRYDECIFTSNVFSHHQCFKFVIYQKSLFPLLPPFFFLVLRGMWHSKVALEEKKKQNQNRIHTQWNEARREGSEMATCLSWLWLLCHMGMKYNSRDTLWGLSKEQFARKNTPYNSKNCTIRSLGQLAAGIFLHIAQGTLIRVRTQD